MTPARLSGSRPVLESYTALEAAATMGGRVVWGSPEATFAGAAYDSRVINPGELFFAIKGARKDGHAFVGAAVQKGAECILVSDWPGVAESQLREVAEVSGSEELARRLAVIAVPDTVLAMGRLAAHHRARHDVRVIGVTGSVGKTTAKDMAAHILEQAQSVLVSEGNLNSDVSMPIVVLRLTGAHRLAVLEMATRGHGQLTYLTQIARPSIGLITVVAPVHVATIGGLADIAAAKAELAHGVEAQGLLAYNTDSAPLREELAARPPACLTVGYGFERGAQVRAQDPVTVYRREGGRFEATLSFTVTCQSGEAAERLGLPVGRPLSSSIPYPGRHNVYNILGAALAAAAAGVPFADGLDALRTFRPRSAMRLDISVIDGLTLIDDAYNANSLSMTAALEILAGAAGDARKAAILGDMRELGPLEAQAHQQLGREAAAVGLELLVCIGPATREYTAATAISAGMLPCSVLRADNHDQASELVLKWLKPGDALLIKGSRGMLMEQVVTAIRKGWAER